MNKFLPKQLKDDPEFIDYQDIIAVLFDPKVPQTKEYFRQKIDEFKNKEVD